MDRFAAADVIVTMLAVFIPAVFYWGAHSWLHSNRFSDAAFARSMFMQLFGRRLGLTGAVIWACASMIEGLLSGLPRLLASLLASAAMSYILTAFFVMVFDTLPPRSARVSHIVYTGATGLLLAIAIAVFTTGPVLAVTAAAVFFYAFGYLAAKLTTALGGLGED